jgi:hypothetical protein
MSRLARKAGMITETVGRTAFGIGTSHVIACKREQSELLPSSDPMVIPSLRLDETLASVVSIPG